jgi:hypothetical protein
MLRLRCIARPARLQFKVMTNIGRSEVALRASAGLFVLMVGCGAALGGVEQNAPTPGTSATLAPSSPCFIGLNCGCIHTCPNNVPQHHPAPDNDHPSDAPAGPALPPAVTDDSGR